MPNYSKMFHKDQDSYGDSTSLDEMYEGYESDFIEETSDSQESALKEEVRTGFVANCVKAYVRENPTKDSNHLTIVSEGDELLVEYSTENWYKITTQSGIEGYIMKELVRLV